jgi:transposase-like protein
MTLTPEQLAPECPHDNYEDYGDGMCAEGCCDRYRCKDCGKIFLVEGAD